MEVIIVNRKLSTDEEVLLLNQLSKNKNITLYSNTDIPDIISKYSKGFIDISVDKKKEINFKVFKNVIDFGELEIDGISVTDFLMFEKTSIWHYHKFRVYFFIRNLIYEIELLESLSNNYKKITCYSNYNILENHSFSNPKITIITGEKKIPKINIKSIASYTIFFVFRLIISIFKIYQVNKAEHLIIDHTIRQVCLSLKTLKPELNNYNLAYLFEKLPKNYLIIDDVEIPKLRSDKRFKIYSYFFKTQKTKFNGEYILFNGIINQKINRELRSISKDYKEKYNKIENVILNQIDSLIINYLRSIHNTTRFFLFKYLSYKRFFANYQFKSISTIDENSPRIKAIIDAAKYYNVKTFGIQHGTIHELHPSYIYSKNDEKRGIVPDFTLVWGEHWKNLLIKKGNYPKDSIKIVGQIRTDIIPKLSAIKSKDHEHKSILYASQFQRDLRLREKSAIDIFSSVRDIENTHLIIKLHPSEKNEFDYYHFLAKKTGCTNYSITYFSDLYDLIIQCDIVITCFSTVGAEAVYFGKPLIILDHLKQDIQNYYRSGVAFQATDSDELRNYIQMILDNKLQIDKNKYQKFINDYAYKIDGNVSNRILEFITNNSDN